MIGWNPSYNWSHEELTKVMKQSFDVEKEQSICLDVEHSDRRNMDNIMSWVKQMGYEAEEVNSDIIRVRRPV